MKPQGDGLAKPIEFEIELLVELVDRERLRTMFPGSDVLDELTDQERRDREVEGFLELVKDWRKVADKGAPLRYDEENAKKLLGVPMFAGGFESSYLAAWTGQAEIREGNSDASSDDGPADGQRRKAPRKR